MELNKDVVVTLDKLFARGLCAGVGRPDGKMCVEAAVCMALGEPFSDKPSCVADSVRAYSINLNDSTRWKSSESRARGMRELAIAQLGSLGVVDDTAFATRLAELTIREILPALFRSLKFSISEMLAAADECERDGTPEAARKARDAAAAAYAAKATDTDTAYYAYYAADAAADAAAYAAYAAYAAANAAANANAYAAYAAANAAANANAGERFMTLSASLAVRVLRELKSPGCELLT